MSNLTGLEKVDYANMIYRGIPIKKIIFEKKGYVYGPIRLSISPNAPEYEMFVKLLSNTSFIQNKIAVFFIRDPRDIIISAYHSFGYTHGFSPVKEIRGNQEKKQNEIQQKTVDEYALETAPTILKHFQLLDTLNQNCNRSIVLKYEDMIDNWSFFSKRLNKYIHVKKNILNQLYEETRPLEIPNETSHRRSGKTNQYKNQLSPETIKSLNNTFKEILARFNYED